MPNRIKLIYVISTVDFSYTMKWLAFHMPRDKYDVTFVFMFDRPPVLLEDLNKQGIKNHFIKYKGKYSLPKATWQLFLLFRKVKPDIVHAHLFEASLVTITAALAARVPIRVYTRHHASLHHDNFPHAIKYDRFLNTYSHKIIAISENVKSILTELDKADPDKVITIHHGFDFEEFKIDHEKVKHLKEQYNLKSAYPVIGVISRFTNFKGIQFIIEGFAELLKEYPNAVLVLANAIGDYKKHILEQLNTLPENSYRLITFEQDVFSLYKCFDVFVHTPINPRVEAFGQIYVEAMVLEIPVVCTLSGIAFEFIHDAENAIVVPFCDGPSIASGITKLLKDEQLKHHIIRNAHKDVAKYFGVKAMIDKLDNLYTGLLKGIGR